MAINQIQIDLIQVYCQNKYGSWRFKYRVKKLKIAVRVLALLGFPVSAEHRLRQRGASRSLSIEKRGFSSVFMSRETPE
jgi:hypothetical protein